ncbi:MAG: hypothetical protein ACLUIW_09685 [Dysosmobacter welbionis]
MTCFRPDGHLTDAALTALVRGTAWRSWTAWSWRNIWPTATSASSGTQSCCLRDRC